MITHLKPNAVELHAELPLEQRATEQDLPERFNGHPEDETLGLIVEVQGGLDENGRYPVKELHTPYHTFPVIWLHESLFTNAPTASSGFETEPVERKPKVTPRKPKTRK
ncbi:MAG: hypothetical protein ACO395_07625 [Pontimonas sp.]